MSDYPLLRASLDARYANVPIPELQRLVREIYGPGVMAEDVEGMFDTIGAGFQQRFSRRHRKRTSLGCPRRCCV